LTISPTTRIVEPTAAQASHWPDVRSAVVKKPRRTSISTSRISSPTTMAVARNAEELCSVSRLNTLRVKCRTLSRLNTWKNTNVANAIVPATVASPNRGAGPGAH
jgi:hypothetical protein